MIKRWSSVQWLRKAKTVVTTEDPIGGDIRWEASIIEHESRELVIEATEDEVCRGTKYDTGYELASRVDRWTE